MFNRLRHLRLRMGLSQTELAARAGISQNDISLFERGVKEMTDGECVNMCRALRLNIPIVQKTLRGRPRRKK